jgi:hypothetical protein
VSMSEGVSVYLSVCLSLCPFHLSLSLALAPTFSGSLIFRFSLSRPRSDASCWPALLFLHCHKMVATLRANVADWQEKLAAQRTQAAKAVESKDQVGRGKRQERRMRQERGMRDGEGDRQGANEKLATQRTQAAKAVESKD